MDHRREVRRLVIHGHVRIQMSHIVYIRQVVFWRAFPKTLSSLGFRAVVLVKSFSRKYSVLLTGGLRSMLTMIVSTVLDDGFPTFRPDSPIIWQKDSSSIDIKHEVFDFFGTTNLELPRRRTGSQKD